MKLIDEARKLLVVREIIDSAHFTGVWRGQAYECRALPDTSLLSVGDAAFCHVLPGNTELVAVFPPSGAIWFSPGAISYEYGELWKYTGSGLATLQYTCTNIYEHITHIFWCQGDASLYMCTYQDDTPTYTQRVYRINMTTGVPTLVASRAYTHSWPLTPDYSDPVIDSAEFGSYVYLLCGAYYASPCDLLRFDYAAGTLTMVMDVSAGGGFGYGGGIAVMGGNLVVSDGNYAYVSPSGNPGSFAMDFDLTGFNATDNSVLFTNKADDDLIYGGQFFPVNVGDPEIVRRTGAGAWVAELDQGGGNTFSVVSFTQEHAAGVPIALWEQNWGDGSVWSKAAGGGAWAQDWAGPGLFGTMSEGLVLFKAKIFGMWADNFEQSHLYRRDAPGNWVLVQSWDLTYERVPTTATVGAMCVAPNASRLCHEA